MPISAIAFSENVDSFVALISKGLDIYVTATESFKAKVRSIFNAQIKHQTAVETHKLLAEICPEMHVNEIHLLHDRHHKVSSLMKFHQNTKLH